MWPWIIFTIFVLGMLVLDLGVFHRNAHVVTKKEAVLWSLVWILLALAFNASIYYVSGPEQALEFLTGYVIEYSLSVDNILSSQALPYFAVPEAYRHRVLLGHCGRAPHARYFIALWAALLHRFHWIIYISWCLPGHHWNQDAPQGRDGSTSENNAVIKLPRRIMPITDRYEGQRFFVTHHGQSFHAPLGRAVDCRKHGSHLRRRLGPRHLCCHL
jgi:tellurite resistance protein TerC